MENSLNAKLDEAMSFIDLVNSKYDGVIEKQAVQVTQYNEITAENNIL
jgi:hypothetical protein